MRKPVTFHPAAHDEAAAAMKWYGDRSPKAAAAFLAELDLACELLADAPKLYPATEHGTRRYLMRRFPFQVIFRERQDAEGTIEIIAVAHGHRRPGYWREERVSFT